MSEYKETKIVKYDMHVQNFETGTFTFEDWEVGQFIRLMNFAILDGHDATLTADVAELQKIARSSHPISPKVLSKFKLNEDGRLYNERLLDEWNRAKGRAESARDKAEKGWELRRQGDAPAMPKQSRGKAKGLPISISTSIPISTETAEVVERSEPFKLEVEEA